MGRYRYDEPEAEPSAMVDYEVGETGRGATHPWERRPQPVPPAPPLTELLGSAIGNRVAAGQAGVLDRLRSGLPDLPAGRPVSASRGTSGCTGNPREAGTPQHNKTSNGPVAADVTDQPSTRRSSSQIGEQRFNLKVN